MARPTYDRRTWWAPTVIPGHTVAHRIAVVLDAEGIAVCGEAVPMSLRPYVDGDERCHGCFLGAEGET